MVRDAPPDDTTVIIDGPPPEGIPPEGPPVWNDIIIEAEAYTSKVDVATFEWTETTTVMGYSGTSYMQIPGNGAGCGATTIGTVCSELRYSVSIPANGLYYVHARMYAVGSSDNSVFWGLDEVVDASPLQPTGDSTWRWVTTAPVAIGAGTHLLGIWHREAGARVDVVAITQTSTPPP